MDHRDIIFKIKVLPKDIDFVNKIIESHEGLALVTTEDPHEGLLLLHTSSDFEDELLNILNKLTREIDIL